MVGDRVEELRSQALDETPLELVDLQPVLVHGDGDDVGLEAAERHDRADVRRPLDDDGIAAIEERLRDELERFDRTARDHELVLGRTTALQGFEPAGERIERSRETSRGRVLERARLARRSELSEQRCGALARERERVGEAARERDHVGQAEEREDVRDPLADVPARAGGEELVPAVGLGRDRHVPGL